MRQPAPTSRACTTTPSSRALLAAGACAEAYNCRYEQPLAVRAHADGRWRRAGARGRALRRRSDALLTAVRERAPRIAALVLDRREPAARPALAAEAALLAARSGAPAVLERIVAAHPACNAARDRGGRTALHLACEHRDWHTLEAALRACGAAALLWTDGAGLAALAARGVPPLRPRPARRRRQPAAATAMATAWRAR